MPKEITLEVHVGRPPKDPQDRISIPVRALVTKRIAEALRKDARIRGVNPSDVFRLYMVVGLKRAGAWTPEIEADPSWDSLKEKGLL